MSSRSGTHTHASNMKVFLKILKWFGIIVGCCALVLVAYISLGDWIRWQYAKWTWSPPEADGDLRVGISKGDLTFYVTKRKVECAEKKGNSQWCGWSEGSLGPEWVVHFEDDKVVYWDKEATSHYDLRQLAPFLTVDEMKQLLGDEDIYAESHDGSERRYTYLEYGVSYKFKQNKLTEVSMGDVTWRPLVGDKPMSSYIVKGKKLCPSPECPFDEKNDIKKAFADKSYKDFLN